MNIIKMKFTACFSILLLVTGIAHSEVLFWSTQAKPVNETQAMRTQVTGGFSQGVDYQANGELV
jgi:multiple sugar transport system substrate-binding protein